MPGRLMFEQMFVLMLQNFSEHDLQICRERSLNCWELPYHLFGISCARFLQHKDSETARIILLWFCFCIISFHAHALNSFIEIASKSELRSLAFHKVSSNTKFFLPPFIGWWCLITISFSCSLVLLSRRLLCFSASITITWDVGVEGVGCEEVKQLCICGYNNNV